MDFWTLTSEGVGQMYDYYKHVIRSLGGNDFTSKDQKLWCPAHTDDKPSLHVTVQQSGNVLLHCFAGCNVEDVLQAADLDMMDLHPPGARATPSLCHQVYTTYMEGFLSLDVVAEADLRKRGHFAGLIAYKSASVIRSANAHAYLANNFDEDMITSVPGFGDWYPAVETGLIIPVRDWRGRISALQFRQYDREPKYVWFSGGSCKLPYAPVHVASVGDGGDTLLVTEGALKADMVSQYAKCAVVGLPGVTAWNRLLDMSELAQFKRVRLAIDMDWLYKDSVYYQLTRMAHAINQRRKVVEVYVWNPKYKGLDDHMNVFRDEWSENMDQSLTDLASVEKWRKWGREQWPQEKLCGKTTTSPTTLERHSTSESCESPKESTSLSPACSG